MRQYVADNHFYPLPFGATSAQYRDYYAILMDGSGNLGEYSSKQAQLKAYSDRQSDFNIANNPEWFAEAKRHDSLEFLAFEGKLALGGMLGGVAEVVPTAGALLSGYGIGSGAHELSQGHYVQGAVEMAGGLIGGAVVFKQVAGATSPMGLVWQSPLGEAGQVGCLSESSVWGPGEGVPDTTRMAQTGGGNVEQLADDMYASIRASSADVQSIAENTGFKPSNIQKIKDHVFYNEHLLDSYVD